MNEAEITSIQLQPRASRDLADIWTYTANQWSVGQAERYLRGMELTLQSLIEFPLAARERTEFSPPVRIKHYQSHIIVYRLEAPYVTVVRVLHGRSDWHSILDVET